MNSTVSISDMFKAGAHFGYSKARRHPSMKKFIFGVKNKTEVFDLEKTAASLEDVKVYIAGLAEGGKKILFVGGKPEARKVIAGAGDTLSMPYVASRWIGGTLTNFSEVKKRVARLEDLSEKREKGELAVYTKKERLLFDREIEDLDARFGGLRGMKEMPAAMFVADPKAEEIAVLEAQKKGIPVVALASSDCDAKAVKLVIPANDSSRGSIELFVNEVVSAYKSAQGTKKEVEVQKEEKTKEDTNNE